MNFSEIINTTTNLRREDIDTLKTMSDFLTDLRLFVARVVLY